MYNLKKHLSRRERNAQSTLFISRGENTVTFFKKILLDNNKEFDEIMKKLYKKSFLSLMNRADEPFM